MKQRFCVLAAMVLVWVLSFGVAQAQTAPDVYDGTKLTGTWAMSTKTVLSTCSSEYVGKSSSNRWNITYDIGFGVVKIVSDSAATFTGSPPNKIADKYKMYMYANGAKNIVYELTMQSETKFTGRRMFASEDTDGVSICVTLSDVELKKTAGVRDIDWNNRKYTSGSYDVTYPVTLVNGATKDGEYRIDTIYGDITGDGADEAIILWSWQAPTPGNGYGTPGADVYSIVDSKLLLIGSIEGGLSGTNVIDGISVENNKVIVIRTVWDDGDPQCCASLSRTEEWSFKPWKMVKTKTIKTEPYKNPY